MLATGEVEVHGPQEAVGRIVEGPTERGPGRLDEHLAQRRGHALGAEGTAEHRRHRGENTARIDVTRRFTAPLRAAGPVRWPTFQRREDHLMTTAIAPRRLRRTVLAGAMLAGTVLAAVLPTAASAAVLSTQLTDGSIAPAVSSSTIKLTPIASGLSSPVLITSARDGTGRLFIVEQTGTIRVYSGGTVLSTPLLNISSSVSKGNEQGLLGLAFHPNFKTNHKFYVNYTNTSGNTVVREYRTSTSNPNRVAAGSGRTILRINQPYSNHNGGNLAFGPDGLLYIGMGDGGDGGDPGNRAQRKNTLLGKMLRINVNTRTGDARLRDPDVEPVRRQAGPQRDLAARPAQPVAVLLRPRDRQPVDRRRRPGPVRGGRPRAAAPGRNWGWRQLEGYHCYRPVDRLQHVGQGAAGAQVQRMPTAAARSPAATCTAAPRSRRCRAGTCSATTAAARSGRSGPTPGRTRRRRSCGTRAQLISSFGENAAGELFVRHARRHDLPDRPRLIRGLPSAHDGLRGVRARRARTGGGDARLAGAGFRRQASTDRSMTPPTRPSIRRARRRGTTGWRRCASNGR